MAITFFSLFVFVPIKSQIVIIKMEKTGIFKEGHIPEFIFSYIFFNGFLPSPTNSHTDKFLCPPFPLNNPTKLLSPNPNPSPIFYSALSSQFATSHLHIFLPVIKSQCLKQKVVAQKKKKKSRRRWQTRKLKRIGRK
jgi:hypothetical protein